MLSATGLTVHLGRRRVLDAIDFTALPGRITAIIGPNGSGKTTLLRALAGDLPYTGTARLNGLPVATTPPWQMASHRAVLEQHNTVSFGFTALEVARLGLANSPGGVDPMQALADVGLAHKATCPVAELSGGEQQRCHLARVLVQLGCATGVDSPRWMLLDEPVAALDIAHQLQVMQIAQRFAAAGGGVVAILHDLNLTAAYANNVALLAAGRLVAQGPVDAVLTDAALSKAYGCQIRLNQSPPAGTWFLPQMAVNHAVNS